jgi:Zn-finger nucleic acid-binding protein
MTRCPTCNEEMREKLVEWKKGIYARAEVCPKCKEEWLDLEEHERVVREYSTQNILRLKRNIIKLGKSLAVRIPKDIENALNLTDKDQVEIFTTRDGIVLKPVKYKKAKA